MHFSTRRRAIIGQPHALEEVAQIVGRNRQAVRGIDDQAVSPSFSRTVFCRIASVHLIVESVPT
ncbi:MAG TPA: hypothetical protein VGX03_00660 [Candidatus Binatia bacterium]|jgi:hypothetical protein|nr:hypothetical protein [Candidatus Binatia bacterium]